MKCKHLKLIMELIFIFILPLCLLLPSFKLVDDIVYDENGNYKVSNKELNFTTPFSYYKDYHYVNHLHLNQKLPLYNANSYFYANNVTLTFDGNVGHIVSRANGGNVNSSRSSIPLNINHVYLYSVYINSYSTSVAVYAHQSSNYVTLTNEYVNLSFTESGYTSGFFNITDRSSNNWGDIYFTNLMIIDLTDMFGAGYEPSASEFWSIVDYEYFAYGIDTIIDIYSNDIISSDYSVNTTIAGKIELLFTNYLDFDESPILDFFIAYTFLWLMMFVAWHFLYSLFDFIVHLVDKDRKRE